MKIATFGTLAAAALLTVATPATAQMRGVALGPTLEVTPFAGATLFTSDLIGDTSLDGGAAVGGHLGLRLSPRIGIEGTFSYAPTDFEGTAGFFDGADGFFDGGDTNVFMYGGGLNFYAPTYSSRIDPFFSAGAGAKTYDFETGGSETDFMGYFGPGVVIGLNPALGLRLEARDYISKFDSGVAGSDSEWQHDVLITAGLSLRLR